MKISARNVLQGTVSSIRIGAVNAEVDLITAGGDHIVAIITNESVQSLGLVAGCAVIALIKANSVMVMLEGSSLRLSARNCLPGQVTKVTPGPVSAEVAIEIRGSERMHASITSESVKELGIAPGLSVTAVFKATSVILAVAG
jgi:molybdate transport system regulatory protein